jgi:hypothetical protein
VDNPKLKTMNPIMAQAVVEAAEKINSRQRAQVPQGLSPAEMGAFRDYATEYLGLLALIKGGEVVEFAKSEEFYKHLGKLGSKNLSNLLLYFPQDKANPLSDSQLITDDGKSFHISSKAGATGKGAAPSLDSLTIPDSLKSAKNASGKNPFKAAITFIETAQSTSSFLQPFALANLLMNKLPVMNGLLAAQQIAKFDLGQLDLAKDSNRATELIKKYLTLLDHYGPRGRGTTGPPLGRLRYYVAKEVMEVINSGQVLTNFKSAVLEILGYNFIQLNTKPVGDQFVTTVNWPATVTGNVTLENKYGANQVGGKLSFMIHS